MKDRAPSLSPAERDKRRAARNSVFAALFLTGMKLLVGIISGSLGILAEAAHSGLDLAAALVTLMAVRISDKPPDHEHTYGHGKVENFSALVETILLFATCAWIVYEAVDRIFFRVRPVEASVWAFLVMAVSIGIDRSRSRMLYRTARAHNSQALEADALHFSTDIWSSSVVIGGLALVWLGRHAFPSANRLLERADAVAALGVAFIVFFVSYRLGKRTIDVLLDRAPEGAIQAFSRAAAGVDGVLNVSQVRVRRSGARVFVDMNVEVDRNLSIERTHAIAEAVEAEVQRLSPGADVVVHTDPRAAEREDMARRIRGIASRNQMAVHNIGLQEDKGGVVVDLHLEVEDHLSLEQAHEMSSRIERDIRADLPAVSAINTHIESRGTSLADGPIVTRQEGRLVRRIRGIVDELAGRRACHEITLRRHGRKFSVALHCTFSQKMPIVEVHAITTRIEDKLRAEIPSLERIIVHAEPKD
jgi:cation diffusion facilitator family transporter